MRINSVVTREQILNNIFCDEKSVTDRAIDSHIKNIRKKINNITSREYIKTVYGLGYSMVGIKDEA